MRLSESGKLFYKAYTLLKDANSELNQYLNEMMKETKVILKKYVDEKESIIPCELQVHELNNKNSDPSRAAIQITVPPDNLSDVTGKIRVICFDMRNHEYESDSSMPAAIEVWADTKSQKMIKRLKGIAQDSYGMSQDIFDNSDLQLSMSDSEEDAQIVADAIIQKSEQVLALLSKP